MRILKGILSESEAYYIEAEKKLRKRIAKLPKGSVKKRVIRGKPYWYLQRRDGKKVIHEYVGRTKPVDLISQTTERKSLKKELKIVLENLKLLKKTKATKHDGHNK